MNLNERELATVLAALRYFQNALRCDGAENLRVGWMDHFGDVMPLTEDEVDSLCERLNLQPCGRA